MKPESSLSDDGLRRLLRERWTVDVRPTAEFRTGVWARIEARRARPVSWGGWLRLHVLGVGLATATCLTVAVLGGGWAARAQVARQNERMLASYVLSIDPHARPGLAPLAAALP